MWIENKIYLEDLNTIVSDRNIEWNLLNNKKILVTGATGLIGSLMVNTLLYLNKVKACNIEVYALVRDVENAKKIFENQIGEGLRLNFIKGDICQDINFNEEIDYIIHAASQTSSKKFVEEPIEIIDVIIEGTKNVLKLARKVNAKEFIFLSTMEVYGRQNNEEKINEMHSTNLNPMETRNCYPLSKIMAENLCTCYADKYNLSVKVIRLTQTFGPGVKYNDGRVFAEFARNAIEGKNIILHTLGETKRNYLYTADCIRAIITILLYGENKEAYNVANEETYCSILEMANLVAEKHSNKGIQVICEPEKDLTKYGYSQTLKLNLDTSKVQKLGWYPKYDLGSSFERMISTMEEERRMRNE